MFSAGLSLQEEAVYIDVHQLAAEIQWWITTDAYKEEKKI